MTDRPVSKRRVSAAAPAKRPGSNKPPSEIAPARRKARRPNRGRQSMKLSIDRSSGEPVAQLGYRKWRRGPHAPPFPRELAVVEFLLGSILISGFKKHTGFPGTRTDALQNRRFGLVPEQERGLALRD